MTKTPKRAPFWLYPILLTLLVFNLYTISGTVILASQYLVLDVGFSPVLRIVLAFLWAIVFGALIIGLAIRHPLSYMCVAPALTIYGLANIAGTMLFARSEFSSGQVGFQVIMTVLAIIPVWWLAWRRSWLGQFRARVDKPDSSE